MTVADGSRTLKIGLMLPQAEGMRGPGVRGWKQVDQMARVAEDVGFDSLWLVDHLSYKLDGEDEARGVWEVWSLLSAVAAVTKRVELGTLVLCMGWRNPALLAKMADTVEEISGGRLILGLGSGYHKHEFDAFGFPFGYKVSRFEEAIQIVHGLLRNGEIDFEGKFHFARECELKPRGPRPEGPPILMGATSKWSYDRIAEYCDGWLPIAGLDGEHLQHINAAWAKRGREGEPLLAMFGVPPDEAFITQKLEEGFSHMVFGLPPEGPDAVLPMLDQYAAIAEKMRG